MTLREECGGFHSGAPEHLRRGVRLRKGVSCDSQLTYCQLRNPPLAQVNEPAPVRFRFEAKNSQKISVSVIRPYP
jgi:hypothetical protein